MHRVKSAQARLNGARTFRCTSCAIVCRIAAVAQRRREPTSRSLPAQFVQFAPKMSWLYGDMYGYGGHDIWSGRPSMSASTLRNLDTAKSLFVKLLREAKFAEGTHMLRQEVVQFHITEPALKELKTFVKAHAGCKAHGRKISAAEKAASADKHLKRTPQWVAFTVTREAQAALLGANQVKRAA